MSKRVRFAGFEFTPVGKGATIRKEQLRGILERVAIEIRCITTDGHVSPWSKDGNFADHIKRRLFSAGAAKLERRDHEGNEWPSPVIRFTHGQDKLIVEIREPVETQHQAIELAKTWAPFWRRMREEDGRE